MPASVARLLESVGGLLALLGLVAMASDTDGLYAALKALLCANRHNRQIAQHMNASRGFQVTFREEFDHFDRESQLFRRWQCF